MANHAWLCCKRDSVSAVLQNPGLFPTLDVEINEYSEREFSAKFGEYVLSNEKTNLTVILDIECNFAISLLIEYVSRLNDKDLSQVTIIVLSHFCSWGGKSYTDPIYDLEEELKRRVPLATAYDAYMNENLLMGLATRSNANICVVGVGLIYGGKGYDLEPVIRHMWVDDNSDNVKPYPLIASSGDKVPMIHFKRLVHILKSLVVSDQKLPYYIAGSDRSRTALFDVVVDMDKQFNNHTRSRFAPISHDSALELMCIEPTISAWCCEFVLSDEVCPLLPTTHELFVGDDCATLEKCREIVWSEFVEENSLKPLTLAVAGAPGIGKTEVSTKLAARLGVGLANVVEAARFVLTIETSCVANSVATAVQKLCEELSGEVRKVLEAAAGGKKGKGQAAPVDDGGAIDPALLTPDVCTALPEALLRRCVAVFVQLHPVCRRRGCVLDVWDGRTVVGAQSLAEAVVRMQELVPSADLASHDGSEGGAENSGTGTGAAVEGEASLLPSTLQAEHGPVLIDMIVELQCPASLPVERLTATLGAQIKAKESQTALKALEAAVATYQDSLAPLLDAHPVEGADETEPVRPAHLTLSHKGVLEVQGRSAALTALRVDCAASDNAAASSLDSIVRQVFLAANAQRGGVIGWLDQADVQKELDAVTTAEEQAVTEELDSVIAAEDAKSGGGDLSKRAPEELEAEAVGPSEETTSPIRAPCLADQIITLSTDNMEGLKSKAAKLEAFLNATVLSQITSGMVQVLREQPDDPIRYLSAFLRRHSEEKCAAAEEAARAEFEQLLRGQ